MRRATTTLGLWLCGALIAGCAFGRAQPTPEPAPSASPPPAGAMANPASVHCEQNSGKLDLRQDASGGAVGICVFADGSECDEWAYFRAECRPGDSLATPVPAASAEPTAEPAGSGSSMSNPAGLRVAYVKAGSIMLWSAGTGPRRLVEANNGGEIRISDDGQTVAFLAQNSGGADELQVVNADGANHLTLAGQDYVRSIQPEAKIAYFDFAPASQAVFFVTDQYDLHRVDTAGGAPTRVLGAGQGGFFSFSPDGQWMTMYHPNELTLARADGTGARVAFQYPEDFSYTMVGPEIIWNADSSGFSLISPSEPQGSPNNMTVWFVPVAGEPMKQISYTGPYGGNLSPDGRSLVYIDYRPTPVEVHVVTADGKDTLYGSYAIVSFMGWAPDARHFLLNLSQDGRLNAPFVCAVDEAPAKLTDTDDALPVRWIDSLQVLFVSHGMSLRQQRLGAPSTILEAEATSWFDYTVVRP